MNRLKDASFRITPPVVLSAVLTCAALIAAYTVTASGKVGMLFGIFGPQTAGVDGGACRSESVETNETREEEVFFVSCSGFF